MFDVRSGVYRAMAVVLLVGLVPAPGFGAAQPYGGATPQELVARMRAAAEAGDVGELMACMAPEDRKAMGGTMVMMAVMMVSLSQMGAEMGGAMAEGMTEAFGGDETSPEQKAEMEAQKTKAAASAAEVAAKLRAALEPHGLAGLLDTGFEPGADQDQEIEAALDQADMVALTESVMAVLDELKDAEAAEGMDVGEGPADETKPDWVDVEVTGYAIDGDHATAQAGEETLEMIRVDGRWFFAPQPQQDPAMGMEMPEPDDGGLDGT